MRLISFVATLFFLSLLLSHRPAAVHPPAVSHAVEAFKADADAFAASTKRLQSAIALITKENPESITEARESLMNSRLHYKKLEYFLEYFFKSSAVIYNSPAKYEVEEPFMEYQTPIGLQVIESLVFDEDVVLKKGELLEQAEAVRSSGEDLNSLLYGFHATDQQLLESMTQQLIRIFTLGITGFDAPLLKSGIDESEISLSSLQVPLNYFLNANARHSDSVIYYLHSSIAFLNANKDFDSFDRLTFLTRHGLPLQKHLGLLVTNQHPTYQNSGDILNHHAVNLFSADALNINAFSDASATSNLALTALGKKLFRETALSGNNKISCASCHKPEKHFTDGLPKSIGFNGHSTVSRNAPTLLYAGFQFGQFWDARAKSLEEQVLVVLADSNEMNGDFGVIVNRLRKEPDYVKSFQSAFPNHKDSSITTDNIATSIPIPFPPPLL